jgi:cell division protein FtsB
MRLRRENAFLQQELARIQSDPNYQEKIAREKMGLVRKGEVPIRIVPEQQE